MLKIVCKPDKVSAGGDWLRPKTISASPNRADAGSKTALRRGVARFIRSISFGGRGARVPG